MHSSCSHVHNDITIDTRFIDILWVIKFHYFCFHYLQLTGYCLLLKPHPALTPISTRTAVPRVCSVRITVVVLLLSQSVEVCEVWYTYIIYYSRIIDV